MRGDVPAAPLREAFLRSGLPVSNVARACGWQPWRVERVLGLKPQPRPVSVPLEAKQMSYENAIALADALGLDYTDAGV